MPKITLIDTSEGISELLEVLRGVKRFAMDCEGHNLGRYGTLSTIQIAVDHVVDQVWIVDVTVLGALAFDTCLPEVVTASTPGAIVDEGHIAQKGVSLRQLLEDATVEKVIFAAKYDDEALVAHVKPGITMKNVSDLQTLSKELLRSDGTIRSKPLPSLEDCLQSVGIHLPWQFAAVKNRGKALYVKKRGGVGCHIWDVRPLHPDLITYAAQDTVYLLRLRDSLPVYKARVTGRRDSRYDD